MSAHSEDIREIKQRLQGAIAAVVRRLCPDGRVEGRYWMAKNPTRDDRAIGSFWVVVKGGDAVGAWRDEATGDKGDVISLIQYVMGYGKGRDAVRQALAWARDFLQMPKSGAPVSPAVKRAQDDSRLAARLAEEKIAQERLAKDRNRAFATWLKCRADLTGTPAAAYLASRGIDLAALAQPPRALRYMASSHHIESRRNLPALVSLMTGPDGRPFAIHRIFLQPDGSGKADVTPQRKIWPSFKGGAIRLANGASKLTPEEATRHGLCEDLVLCEGVEDGLSIALACPELRVWAAGSLGNIGAIELPKCIERVIVAADNDWGKPQAEALLERGVRALQSQGVRVLIARSPIGKDANDALRSSAAGAQGKSRVAA